jgi:hypothetical protein
MKVKIKSVIGLNRYQECKDLIGKTVEANIDGDMIVVKDLKGHIISLYKDEVEIKEV